MARVLLVEDEGLLRETLSMALQDAGHMVTACATGAAAMATLEKAQFDVLVTDILMPETDGLELIRRLRKSGSDLRIIAMSGGGRTRNMDMLGYAKSFGADAALVKPFLPRDLLDAITAPPSQAH